MNKRNLSIIKILSKRARWSVTWCVGNNNFKLKYMPNEISSLLEVAIQFLLRLLTFPASFFFMLWHNMEHSEELGKKLAAFSS